ncbi:hypothetical protein [Mycobacterium sp. 852014-52144_SCH5372336]|uniref:hypothetical protein n=1 Tax=Mycobacterium sp. 852014-52144_SCH5372336 TaxID=1834115 RepID=UPI0007FEDAC2|nr:hypothetical protein [Mycobacterium sp. 852014-52144_SCH5372336]OBB73655.1 hypothetical protein A5759_14680 [Mycobacterium sp. 852014-52144_SCH5372336]
MDRVPYGYLTEKSKGEMSSDRDHDAPDPAPDVPDDSAQLAVWERAVALLIGLAAVGGGAVAVFTSDNQAGTAGLLVIALAFLVIGTQGTPLVKLSSGEQTLELTKRRIRRELTEQAENAPTAEAANAYEDAAAIVEGSWKETSFASARGYERDVFTAVHNLYPHKVFESPTSEAPYDFYFDADGVAVAVAVKYRAKGPLSHRELLTMADRMRGQGLPLLVVTNAPLSPSVSELSEALTKRAEPVIVTRWTSPFSARDLRDAILQLISLAKEN